MREPRYSCTVMDELEDLETDFQNKVKEVMDRVEEHDADLASEANHIICLAYDMKMAANTVRNINASLRDYGNYWKDEVEIREDKVNELEKRVSELENKLSDKESELEDVLADVKTMQDEINHLQKEIEELESTE